MTKIVIRTISGIFINIFMGILLPYIAYCHWIHDFMKNEQNAYR